MELWIRSQNKDKLFKINGVDVTKMNDNSYEITGYTTYDIYLGNYKTKERALEVLDEIQKKINLINLGRDFRSPMIDLDNPTYIYEMPQD